MLLHIEPGLFKKSPNRSSAWGQKSCYFPFHFSVDMLTSPAMFSFVFGLKLSRIFKEKEKYLWWEGGSGSRQMGRGPIYGFIF